jgi:hypothetical protein
MLTALFGLFAIVCAMVFVTKGKSARWVARKMKLGAAIIALTGVSTGCPVVSCYDPEPTDYILIDSLNYEDYSITADLPADSMVTGHIKNCLHNEYGFEISTIDSSVVQEGSLQPDDGNFNDYNEKFSLKLDPSIENGNYVMDFFAIDPDTEKPGPILTQIKLNVK